MQAMSSSELVGLGQDILLDHVLPLLPVRALGCLACSSKALRSLVASAPQSAYLTSAGHTLHRYVSACQYCCSCPGTWLTLHLAEATPSFRPQARSPGSSSSVTSMCA